MEVDFAVPPSYLTRETFPYRKHPTEDSEQLRLEIASRV